MGDDMRVCPGCGAVVGQAHDERCAVYLARDPAVGTACGPEEVRSVRSPFGICGQPSGLHQGDYPDPWAHRSSKMRCRTCMWYVAKLRHQSDPLESPVSVVGRCRRHAPTMSGFPVVFESDWCGDHRLNENEVR